MDKVAETKLLQQALAGDGQAFESLVRNHYEMVYRCAFRFCGHKEDAEDIAQEVFLKVAKKLGSYDGRASFSSWLYRITMNTGKDLFRKQAKARTVPYENGVHGQAQTSGNPGGGEDILRAMQQLPEGLRQTMALVYGEELSHRQAATILGCAETTVSWRVFQAKRQLKALLT